MSRLPAHRVLQACRGRRASRRAGRLAVRPGRAAAAGPWHRRAYRPASARRRGPRGTLRVSVVTGAGRVAGAVPASRRNPQMDIEKVDGSYIHLALDPETCLAIADACALMGQHFDD